MLQVAARMLKCREMEHHKAEAEKNGERQREAMQAKKDKHALEMQLLECQGRLKMLEGERDASREQERVTKSRCGFLLACVRLFVGFVSVS